MPDADTLIIGSGPAGVHAAQTLTDGGMRVCMIDGGRRGTHIEAQLDGSFETVRRTREDQWKWFLGQDLSAISLAGLTGGLGGGQISGNRKYVADVRDGELPLDARNGMVIQSLARGGLGAGWGAACAMLEDDELTAMGLPVADIRKHYETVGRRIGISGPQTQPWIQPPLPMDHNALSVQRWAVKHQRKLARINCTALQPHSAILSQDLGTRKASALGDMEYWADPGRSVWRPQYTLDALSASQHFSYEGGWIVRRIERKDGQLHVYAEATHEHAGETRVFSARRVVLACGAVNTARVLLASLGKTDVDVPFLAKPRVLAACLNPHAIGQAGPAERISLCQQLLIDHTPYGGLARACAQLYSYRSLMLFRLVGSIPLPMPQALRLASLLASSLVIADIRFPALQSDAATLCLRQDGLAIHFPALSLAEQIRRDAASKTVRQALLATHLIPCKRISMPEGATVHYAGTVPVGDANGTPLTCDAEGRSMQLSGVWIADAASFRALPAKPHTFTLMANACRVAEAILQEA